MLRSELEQDVEKHEDVHGLELVLKAALDSPNDIPIAETSEQAQSRSTKGKSQCYRCSVNRLEGINQYGHDAEQKNDPRCKVPFTSTRRGARVFTPEQQTYLASRFTQTPYPTRDEIAALADELQRPREKVATWFNNRRAQVRRLERGQVTLCRPGREPMLQRRTPPDARDNVSRFIVPHRSDMVEDTVDATNLSLNERWSALPSTGKQVLLSLSVEPRQEKSNGSPHNTWAILDLDATEIPKLEERIVEETCRGFVSRPLDAERTITQNQPPEQASMEHPFPMNTLLLRDFDCLADLDPCRTGEGSAKNPSRMEWPAEGANIAITTRRTNLLNTPTANSIRPSMTELRPIESTPQKRFRRDRSSDHHSSPHNISSP